MPYQMLDAWLEEEKASGAPNPKQAVLSTTTSQPVPHARVVAIREISDKGLLFFTQRGTRKVAEMKDNPKCCLTFWFELKQRQVIIEGIIEALSEQENDAYWQSYPKEARLRFYAYAPTSGQPISSKEILEDKRRQLTDSYKDKTIPISPDYCGFRIKPNRFCFYAYCTPELSDTYEYVIHDGAWRKQILSP
jgi:pyridoxamine 5'-phosphate oxidase